MTHRDEDEEIIDSALDTLAWQRREIDRLKGDVERLRNVLKDAKYWDGHDAGGVEAVWYQDACAILGEKP